MYPELFTLSDKLTVQSYGTLIAMGVVFSLFYARREATKMNIDPAKMIDLFLWVFLAAFVGGRFFTFFERPDYYFGNPANMLKFSGSGFVFYGSLIFAIPTMLIFFKKQKMPVLAMVDMMAMIAVIVHMFGRMGCFMAGCCHGVPTDGVLAVTFTHPESAAEPLGVPLHPTQLYSVFMLLLILATLQIIKKRKQFDGQLFLIYIMMYAIGRSVIEEFRGDEIRGFVFDGLLSHSQLISLIVIIGATIVYYNLQKKGKKAKPVAVKNKKGNLS